MNILVTTMGASWQILPELIGFTDPGLVDLFQYHPGRLKMEKDRQDWGIKKFLKPLTGEGAGVFTPFCLGIFPSYPLADRICSADYPLPFSKVAGPVLFHPLENFPLTSKIADMKSNAGFLMSNYTNKMLQGEIVTNFLALYSLPEAAINRLKAMKFGMDPLRETHELSLLKRLPKAELHCHLGGLASAGELIRICCTAF